MSAGITGEVACELSPAAQRARAVKIVLFSGGTGTQSICQKLILQPQVSLTVIINAYDDGHSTGRMRRFIPGMLGPSDVRKNINRLMPVQDRCHRGLRTLSDHRLAPGTSYEEGNSAVSALAHGRIDQLPAEIRRQFNLITVGQANILFQLFASFHDYALYQAEAGNLFDYGDCALGNILFAGCYLSVGRSFNRTISVLSDLYEVRGTILNVTGGENLFLAARKEDGTFLRGEADIVAAQNGARISDLLLIDGTVYLRSIDENESLGSAELEAAIAMGTRVPDVNPVAADALRSADVIIYGPGTQHSSLLPSYLTRGVAEAIAANKSAEKIFISNIRRDFDLPTEDNTEIVRKFVRCMQRDGEAPVPCSDLATRFFFQRAPGSNVAGAEYIPFDPGRFEYSLEAVRLRDWEGQEGKHCGSRVVNELQQIVQARIDVVLRPVRQMVSVIVPALDEARTVSQCLRSLAALDFSGLELSNEIIFVDGGSTDGTLEQASGIPGIRVLQTEPLRGRGAALRLGIEHARGEIVVFFPADLEYEPDNILRLVSGVVQGEYRAVFGTRNVKCADLSARLSGIYGGHTGLYLLSKYGGMLLSMATLLMYNRYISDPLTCLMAFDAETLRSLQLRANGLDIHTEIIAQLCRRGEYILEVPVDFKPRTRAEGKKTTPLDGARAVLPLIRGKYQAAR